MSKFNNQNKAITFVDQLNNIDFSDANTNNVEASLYAALKTLKTTPTYDPLAIAPLAEPLNINELVGPQFTASHLMIQYQASRLDGLYKNTSNLNNNIKTGLESVEKKVLEVGSALETVKNTLFDSTTYYWITESFNNTSNIDTNKTTAFVDTDYGHVRLTPVVTESINNFQLRVEKNELLPNTLPGANLLVLHSTRNTPTKDPEVQLVTENSKDLGNILDGDPQTKFEVERNFILKNQKCLLLGRAYNYDPTGSYVDVPTVTSDLDMDIIVQWPNLQTISEGIKCKIAEYVSQDPLTDKNADVKFSFTIVFDKPTNLSILRLAPFARHNQEITVDRIVAQTSDGEYFDLATNVSLLTGNSFNTLQQNINRRTGIQSIGTLFYSPTNKPIININVKLSSKPIQVLLSHPFDDEYVQQHTTRHYLFFSTVDNTYWWKRIPINSSPISLQSSTSNPKLIGSFANNILNSLLGSGQLAANALGTTSSGLVNQLAGANAVQDLIGNLNNPLINQASTLSSLNNTTNLIAKAGGVLGKVGGFLAKAVPYIGAATLLSDIVGRFGANTDYTTLEEDKGYDVFYGWRSSLGIQDLSIGRETYTGTGEIYTKKLQFLVPVSKVALFAVENIPNDWGPGDWISYFVSVNGVDWLPINKTSGSDFNKALSFSSPTQEIYFKAIITANPNDIYRSADLNHFALQGLP